jgi:hypothetical protein
MHSTIMMHAGRAQSQHQPPANETAHKRFSARTCKSQEKHDQVPDETREGLLSSLAGVAMLRCAAVTWKRRYRVANSSNTREMLQLKGTAVSPTRESKSHDTSCKKRVYAFVVEESHGLMRRWRVDDEVKFELGLGCVSSASRN